MSTQELDGKGASRPLKILLIEDNADDALLLERYLRRNGFAPALTRVETAAEMLRQLAESELPEFVLADYNLPEFSGPAALEILQASGNDIPFIMLSGAMSEDAAVSSMRAGAQDYVTKQNLARLVPALERELREASERRERMLAERALRASEDRFHRLVEAMPLSLLISDARGRIVYANQASQRLLELTEVKASNVGLTQLFPPLAAAAALLDSGLPSYEPSETICTTTNGRTIEVLIGMAVLNPDAPREQRQLAAFIADLTQQKKSEELFRRTEKLAVAGRLAASIAHEINNPLEAITNLLYLVSGTTLAADAREYLELAQRELDRVAQITVQTLRFHRRSTKAVQTDLDELVQSVLPLFESRLRHLQVEVAVRSRATPSALLHDGEIRQVIANLVSNASDALPQGGRMLVRVSPARQPKTGSPGVSLTVADTGIGMSPETIARIFEPFFSTKGNTGTGLGLWVSQEIIERHLGTLKLRSRQESKARAGGTVFRLFLPLTSEFVDPKEPASERESKTPRALSKP